MIKNFVTLLFCTILASEIAWPASSIKDDEQVIFFPTLGKLSDDRLFWHVRVHGWIFEPGAGQEEKQSLFNQRRRWFLVDNERGKRISVRIGGARYALPASTANGHFRGRIKLPSAGGQTDNQHEVVRVSALMPAADERIFHGRVILVPPEGISVVSDIDDTIKISEVGDKSALMRNTFLLPFRAVPGMADQYRQLEAQYGAVFHYVTSSPWQLYAPLSEFLSAEGFPEGSFHMKNFRMKDRSFLNILKGGTGHKTQIIEQLLRDYPKRRFLLFGDSGEQDPEVYADLAHRYPDRVVAVLIRDTGVVRHGKTAFADVFSLLAPQVWRVFSDPSAIGAFLDTRLQQ